MDLPIITPATTPAKIIDLLLSRRQVADKASFLSPPFPVLSLNLSPALEVIHSTISAGGNILIYGDYDVDGITATAILWQSIYSLTQKVTPFIPHREKDGYGLKAESFFRIQSEKNTKFDLLITVDNGVVASKEIKKILEQQSIKIIVTDHHLPNPSSPLPPEVTLVHTTEISGAAVSWFLARELNPAADLGLAALGTVTDCLPLVGVNRSLVVHGLQSLRLNPSPGIRQLVQISGANLGSLSTYELGFMLGPRINAVGRLSDPTDALRLLCSKDALQAAHYARSLNSSNQDRQVLQKESLDLAESQVDLGHRLQFVADASFHPGVIGLIAGRLTEKYYLPSVAIAVGDVVSKGSCRSIPELNIIEVLRQFPHLFIDLGGHSGAAGFSLKTKNITKLKTSLTDYVDQQLSGKTLVRQSLVDAQMQLAAVTLKSIEAINQLAPFGVGNPEPQFLFKGLKIVSKKILGQQGDHLKLVLDDPSTPSLENISTRPLGTGISGIAFKQGSLEPKLAVGDSLDLVATLSINDWNNTRTPQLIIKEIKV